MEQKKIKQKNHCLDAVKGMAAIMVVFGHAVFPGQFGQMVFTLASVGVPIFFLVSGFYSYNEDSKVVYKKTPVKLQNIAKLTGMTCVLYFVWRMVYTCLKGNSLSSALHEFVPKKIFTLLILADADVIMGSHLWFLFALIYAYITLLLLAKFDRIQWIYPVVVLTFIARIYMTANGNWHYSQNYWVDGLPFFFTGYYLHKKSSSISKIKNSTIGICIIFGIIVCLMKYVYPIPSYLLFNFYEIGSIVAAIMIFIYAHNNPKTGENSLMEILGNRYSLYLYISHVIVLYFVSIYDEKLFGEYDFYSVYEWLKPFLILFSSLLISVLYYKIKHRKVKK
ncbi:MAG: acyltransferase [Lachnospiraceae bacterium]|nr:acyltransferase [Lachnospiraceae bacterium]